MFYLTLPLLFLQFWFLEAPRGLIAYFMSLNSAFLQLFSLPLLIRTFLKPWKSEYREGLVGFSIGMAMFIKSFFIVGDFLLFCALLSFEFLAILGFIVLPFATIHLLFMK